MNSDFPNWIHSAESSLESMNCVFKYHSRIIQKSIIIIKKKTIILVEDWCYVSLPTAVEIFYARASSQWQESFREEVALLLISSKRTGW